MKTDIKESDVTSQIRTELKKAGIWHFKHWGGPLSPKGVSDLIGVLPGGQAFFLEIKRPGGKPSPDQVRFLEKARRAGAVALVADSVEDALAGLGLRTRLWAE